MSFVVKVKLDLYSDQVFFNVFQNPVDFLAPKHKSIKCSFVASHFNNYIGNSYATYFSYLQQKAQIQKA